MNNPGLFQARWNLRRLALCNLVPVALLAFWLWPTGQMLCVLFDEWLYHLLNSPLATNPIWLHVWAIASLRPFDAVVGVILLTLLIKGDWVFKTGDVRQAFFGFFGILLLLLFIRMLFSKLTGYMGWQHSSPSMMIDSAVRMSNYFPGLEARWELKDRSTQSFPGDHASVLLIWALFMTVFQPHGLADRGDLGPCGAVHDAAAGSRCALGPGRLHRWRVDGSVGVGLGVLHPVCLSRIDVFAEGDRAAVWAVGEAAAGVAHECGA